MIWEAFMTCAVTGVGASTDKNPHVPVTPRQIAAAAAGERLRHVSDLLPEIYTLDCGSMNFAEGDYVMTNTLARCGCRRQACGLKSRCSTLANSSWRTSW